MESTTPAKKRIIVACDGTWAYDYLAGGLFGEGIVENIREAYIFICNNYADGDEIFLIGFSRGAFTARSVGGLISDIGLLTSKGKPSFLPIFQDWKNQGDHEYRPRSGSTEWPRSRVKYSDPTYHTKLAEAGLTKPDIPVKAMAIWECVGTRGIPEMTYLGVKVFPEEERELSFISNEVPHNVEYAFQALALDERRELFPPTVWEVPKDHPPTGLKALRQCWFPGVHSSVGGGYDDTSISDITLAWMMTQLQPLLGFDPLYMLHQRAVNEEYYIAEGQPVASWAMGTLDRSTEWNPLGGQTRTPGRYHDLASSSVTGETIHSSVRYRMEQGGRPVGFTQKEPSRVFRYVPRALHDWDYSRALSADGTPAGLWSKAKFKVSVNEDSIKAGTTEMALVESWPGVKAKLAGQGAVERRQLEEVE